MTFCSIFARLLIFKKVFVWFGFGATYSPVLKASVGWG